MVDLGNSQENIALRGAARHDPVSSVGDAGVARSKTQRLATSRAASRPPHTRPTANSQTLQ